MRPSEAGRLRQPKTGAEFDSHLQHGVQCAVAHGFRRRGPLPDGDGVVADLETGSAASQSRARRSLVHEASRAVLYEA